MISELKLPVEASNLEANGEGALPVCLWRENSNRLVSLRDIVKPFYPAIFTTLSRSMYVPGVDIDAAFEGAIGVAPIMDSIRENTQRVLPKQRQCCAELGLIASVATIDRIQALLSEPNATLGEFHKLGQELQGRLDDELFGTLFFSLDASEVGYYNNPIKDWEQVIKTWRKTQIDIEESSKCFACGRYAASVFHALLVAEMGVIEVAKLLGVAGDKPGWGALDRLEKILAKPYKERSSIEQTHSELLKQILPLMLSMKNSWRHKIGHVENRLEWLDTDFSPQLVEEITKAVRGFMRRLAMELEPTPVP
jgi:hypothetical protein